jgi:Putative polyhydroxyalkanoic acid system protein (PHA_gran_rgn)
MDHSVHHDLDLPTAKRVAEKAWASYSERFAKYSPTMRWVNERKASIAFKAKGIAVDGSLELGDGAISMSLEVPFLLRPFKQSAIEVIEREIRRWVDKAKNGDL